MDSQQSRTNKYNKSDTTDKDVPRKLFEWYENRGLLLELRAHMRQQMVLALQENLTGVSSCKKKLSSSPKFQAMRMLIADFLLQQEHHYTLSVFSTEVQILNSLPEFSSYIAEILNNSKNGNLPITTPAPRFSFTDIKDILDTLGLPSKIEVGAKAAYLYVETGEALLTCIVRSLSDVNLVLPIQDISAHNSPHHQINDSEEEILEKWQHDCDHWTKEMRQILLQSDVKIKHINKLEDTMKKFFENELIRVRQAEATIYEDMLRQHGQELREEIYSEFAEKEQDLENQKEDLQTVAAELRIEHEEIKKRLVQLQVESEEIEKKRKEQENESSKINLLIDENECKAKEIEESFTRLAIEEEAMKAKQIKADLDRCSIIIQQNSASTQTQVNLLVDEAQQTISEFQPDQELLLQLKVERDTNRYLQDESVELKACVLQQRTRINELTLRVSNLINQLEEAQRNGAENNNQDRILTITTPPLMPPPQYPLNAWQPNIPMRRPGGGEEPYFTPRQPPAPPRNDIARRSLRFNRNRWSSTSDESSRTDEMVRDARRRLQDLEEQNESINRSYQEFQARQLVETDSHPLQRSSSNGFINRLPNNSMSCPTLSHNQYQPSSRYQSHIRTILPLSDSDEDDFYISRRSLSLRRNRYLTKASLARKWFDTNMKHSKYATYRKRFRKSSQTQQSEKETAEKECEERNEARAYQTESSDRDTSSDSDMFTKIDEINRKTKILLKSKTDGIKIQESEDEESKKSLEKIKIISKSRKIKDLSQEPCCSTNIKHISAKIDTIKNNSKIVIKPLSSIASNASAAVESIPKNDEKTENRIKKDTLVVQDLAETIKKYDTTKSKLDTEIEEVSVVPNHAETQLLPAILERVIPFIKILWASIWKILLRLSLYLKY
uniref:LisH domain-containing protein n=1 Tax=Clastoptera arizonana TaxID=38151 RepID=A0A1B6CJ66_9HEMI